MPCSVFQTDDTVLQPLVKQSIVQNHGITSNSDSKHKVKYNRKNPTTNPTKAVAHETEVRYLPDTTRATVDTALCTFIFWSFFFF